MKWNLFAPLFVVFVFSSCVNKNSIQYSKTTGVELGNLKKEDARFNAILVFNNISPDQFVVKDLVLDFKIDGKDIGTILVKNPKDVRPHSEFNVSVDYMYEPSRILKAGEEPSDVYLVELDGDLTLKNNEGKEVTVPVKYKASYAYKTGKEERIEKRKERKARKKELEEKNNN